MPEKVSLQPSKDDHHTRISSSSLVIGKPHSKNSPRKNHWNLTLLFSPKKTEQKALPSLSEKHLPLADTLLLQQKKGPLSPATPPLFLSHKSSFTASLSESFLQKKNRTKGPLTKDLCSLLKATTSHLEETFL